MSAIGRNTKVFTPAELGIDAVDSTAVATTTGTLIEVGAFSTFCLILESAGAAPTAHVRAIGLGADGTEVTYNLRSNASPLALATTQVYHMGPTEGVLMSNDDTDAPLLGSTMSGLQAVKFQLQITTGAGTTISAHLFCKK